jgi:putative ABC transport system ATP-binding protein
MAAPTVIDCHALDHAFGIGEARAQVLFGVNLTIAQGEFVVLKGASGSGKTTLLTLLACLREIQGGTVEVLGNRLDSARAKRLVEVRRRLGFIFQSHNLHPALTAMQNVRMGLELHGGQAMGHWRQAASHMLTCLGLGERLDYLPAKLSGGQKQRVAIARALVGNPEIVFADEPTAALDAESGRRVVDILKELGRRRGTTSLVVTHDPRVLDCADRVITLDGGRIIDDHRRP